MKVALLTAFALLCSMNVQASNVKKLTRAIKESNLELVQYLLKYKSFTVAQLDDAAQQGEKERAPLLVSGVVTETLRASFWGVNAGLFLGTLKDYLTGTLDRSNDDRNMVAAESELGVLNDELAAGVTDERRLEITQAIQGIDWWMNDPQRREAHLATLRTFGIKSFVVVAALAGLSCLWAIKAFYRGYNQGSLAWQVSRAMAQARANALLHENGKQ